MRTPVMILTTLLAALATPALGQQPPAFPNGTLDLGLRFTDISGDEARFQRFRDLGDGALVERFKFEREGQRWLFDASADHVGRLDQRYTAEFRHNGRLRIAFQWDQTPLLFSRDTRTLYTVEAPGVLRIADSIQGDIQGGRLTLADVIGQAGGFDVKSRRDTAAFGFLYSPTREVDVNVNLTTARRDGTMPFNAAFGFSNAIEVPAPTDTRTTDLTAGVEWTDQRGSLRVSYDGSWFDNHTPALVWDNPLRATDTTFAGAYASGLASSQGRLALPPDSTLHAVSTAGSVKLPARSRLAGSITVGSWRQDEALLPHTINSSIPTIPLERQTAEGEARTLAMNYTFTSRPSPYVWLNARFRYYDFDNRTPVFNIEEYVRLDGQAYHHEGGSRPFGYTRHNFDIDASFTPLPFTAFKVGYGGDWTDRTFRIFDRTTENVVRASVDTTPIGWLTVRGIVERGTREGSGFEEERLIESGEQPAMRHFDIADRDRTRVTGLVQLTPIPALGVSASAAVGHDDYKNSGFGLRDNKNRSYSVTADVTPVEAVMAGVSYSFERYTAFQSSRTASPGPQTLDPTRDWSIDSADKTHTVSGNLDLVQLVPRTELRFGYDFTRSRYTYVYVLPADSTLVAPGQLPPVRNELHTGTADVRYSLTTNVAIGLMYWYERYAVEDFALSPSTIKQLNLPGSLFLGYVYRPYTANGGWLRLIVNW